MPPVPRCSCAIRPRRHATTSATGCRVPVPALAGRRLVERLCLARPPLLGRPPGRPACGRQAAPAVRAGRPRHLRHICRGHRRRSRIRCGRPRRVGAVASDIAHPGGSRGRARPRRRQRVRAAVRRSGVAHRPDGAGVPRPRDRPHRGAVGVRPGSRRGRPRPRRAPARQLAQRRPLPRSSASPVDTPSTGPVPSSSAAVASASPAPEPSTTPAPAASPRTYKVKSGDTIASIAGRFKTTVKAIVAANAITDARTIHPGQILVIP